MDCDADEAVTLRGDVCSADVARAEATLRRLGRLQPALARLGDALASRAWAPLTYGSLLGRGGWEIFFLELTGQCNERCRHCYADSSPERTEQLTWDEVESVVRAARALGARRLQLTGGDPLLSKHCLPAARLALVLGVPHVEVYTNGLALTDSVADELCAVGASFALSFYSRRAAVHDRVTGTPGSQERTVAAIRRVLARGGSVRVSVIATGESRADVQQTIAFLESLGVGRDRIGVDEERSVGRGRFEGGAAHGLVAASDAGGAASHGAQGKGGKLCVSYRGEFFPCIFARGQPLGSLRQGSLASWLSAPLTLRSGRPRLELASAQARLTCRDCRLTEALLGELARASLAG